MVTQKYFQLDEDSARSHSKEDFLLDTRYFASFQSPESIKASGLQVDLPKTVYRASPTILFFPCRLASYMRRAGGITTHVQQPCAETMDAGVLKRWRSSEKLLSFCSRQLLSSCWTSPARHPSRMQSLVYCLHSVSHES